MSLQLHAASDDIRDVDLSKIHNLSGPVAVEGAEPGDCLVVDILDGKTNGIRIRRRALADNSGHG